MKLITFLSLFVLFVAYIGMVAAQFGDGGGDGGGGIVIVASKTDPNKHAKSFNLDEAR
ncbi:hypothetical protein RvY_13612 [Ramazzottius varieornatus]|uniref:Uncharacterized protein n=1 Tax=Ramazzottius varieornatus TaxID=947166 RepID=A0A1D1VTQ1_RAMVA|nr:hypothetical protein RvY_13612 [Ramazzottius varieornatus]